MCLKSAQNELEKLKLSLNTMNSAVENLSSRQDTKTDRDQKIQQQKLHCGEACVCNPFSARCVYSTFAVRLRWRIETQPKKNKILAASHLLAC